MPVDSKTTISIAMNKLVVENKRNTDENSQKKKHADFETAIATSGYGKFQYLLLLTIIPVTWSTSIDTSNVSIILASAECDLQMTFLQKGLLNAVTFLGMVSSGYLWGYVADVRGRRSVFIYGYLADGVCNVLSGFSQNFWMLVFFKFLSGFIISGPHASIVTYCSEFHGIKGRVRIPLIIGFSINLGNIVTSGLAWLVIPQPWSIVLWDGSFVYNSWRIFLSLCGVPALFGVVCLSLFPESPKFLMSQGRNQEALRVFKLIYRINTGKSEEEYPIESLENEPLKKLMTNSNQDRKSQKTAIFFYPHLSWLLLVTAMQFGAMLTMNTIRLWQPQLFTILEKFNSSNYNATGGESSYCEILDMSAMHDANEIEKADCAVVSESVYLKTVVVTSSGSAFLLLATVISRVLSHKKLFVTFCGMALASLLYLNWSTNIWLTLGLTCMFTGLMNTIINIVIGVAVILFPTSLRTIAVSLVMTSGRIGSIIGNVFFPVLLEYGCSATIIALSAFVLMCIVLGCLLPSRRAKK